MFQGRVRSRAAARPRQPGAGARGQRGARPAPAPPRGGPRRPQLPPPLPPSPPSLSSSITSSPRRPLFPSPQPLFLSPDVPPQPSPRPPPPPPPPLSLTLSGFQQHRVGHDVLDFHGRGLLPLRAAGVEAAPAASFAPSSSPATAATPSRRSSGPAGPQRRARLFPITRCSLRHRPPPSPRAEARSRQRPPAPIIARAPASASSAPPLSPPYYLGTTTPRRHRATQLALSQAHVALCTPGYVVSYLIRPHPASPIAADIAIFGRKPRESVSLPVRGGARARRLRECSHRTAPFTPCRSPHRLSRDF